MSGNLRYNDKRDANEKKITRALESVGCTVAQIKGETGMPDLLVARQGINYLIEVKNGNRGRLSPKQKEWHAAWRAPVFTARTTKEALAAVGVEVE